MSPSPRLLLTMDYESWFAISRRYDNMTSAKRRAYDGGFTQWVIDPLLEKLGNSKISFYLVGELVEWYPELPQKIVDAGHEVGFHCQVHRPLLSMDDIRHDLEQSADWRKQYNVRGYRAPMIKAREEMYPLLVENNFVYSSSLYAPTGTMLEKDGIWEFPVSTHPLSEKPNHFTAPRNMNLSLLMNGEFPYASGMMSGFFPKAIFKIIETELKNGQSPVIFFHPYEIIRPERWPARMAWDFVLEPFILPFAIRKTKLFDELLRAFPTSTMLEFAQEVIHERSRN